MKKVLIVTYYWPPAGGPGVQRWLKFVKYLPEFGIEPIVYVPENAHYPLQDKSLMAEVSPDLKLIKKPIFEPYSLAGIFSKNDTKQISSGIIPEEQQQGFLQKLMLFIRGNFFIPDARKFWISPSVKFLKSYLEEQGIDTIITTGPPHSMHLIGLQLKQNLNLKWIADFRDPWTQIGYHKKLKLTSAAKKKHEELELEVLRGADHILTTSYTTREEFKAKTNTPVQVITNGYDQEEVISRELDKKFTLSHIGSLLSGRNPEELWAGLRELTEENEEFAADFQLNLVGAVGETVLNSIRKNGLEPYLYLKDYVSHPEALQLQRSSQLLLLIEIDSVETRGIIPGKIFEYMISRRPILAIGPREADIEKIINETHTGAFYRYSEKENIKKYIWEKYLQYRENNIETHPKHLEKYSRRSLTGDLAQCIKKQL